MNATLVAEFAAVLWSDFTSLFSIDTFVAVFFRTGVTVVLASFAGVVVVVVVVVATFSLEVSSS